MRRKGGIGLEQTVDRVAMEVAEHSPTLAEELAILSAEMAMLNDRRTALSEFGKRVGGHGKTLRRPSFKPSNTERRYRRLCALWPMNCVISVWRTRSKRRRRCRQN